MKSWRWIFDTFRPRRRPKRQRDKREKYHHALKALAIREQKIHIVGSPEFKIEGTPVYLDVEGLPAMATVNDCRSSISEVGDQKLVASRQKMQTLGVGRKRTKIQIGCDQRAQLREHVLAATNLRDKERLQVILWATTGKHTMAELGQLSCRARSTIQIWLDKFESGGVAGLLERDTPPGATSPLGTAVLLAELRDGLRHEPSRKEETSPNPPTNSPEPGSNEETTCPGQSTEGRKLPLAAKALIEILHHNPKIYGINRTTWTLETLADAFEKQFGQKPSRSTVGRLLNQAGLRWKKSRQFLTSPDPNYKEKVELLLKTLQSLKANEDLFFIDELGPLAVRRHGGRCYTPRDQTPTHPQNQRAKGSITLYGALSAKTNQVVWFYGKAKDSAGMIELVEILYNQHHDKAKIYLTWDAASWHRSAELVQWTDVFNTWNSASGTCPHIAFIPLPSNSQFLDVIEAVFSGMKRAVIHNSDYQSPAEMKAAISMHFRARNDFFRDNPKRVGKKMWEIDFFEDHNNIRWGNYREW